MMTELMLVEGVSDVQLISYYLQNVYGWKHEKNNHLGIHSLDEHDHIESLSKEGRQLVLCGVGGNGRFAHFVERHRINSMIIEHEFYPPHLGKEFLEVYTQIKNERIEAKHNGNKIKNETLKLALNGLSGNLQNEHNFCYSPFTVMQIRINGQLLLLMLAEQLIKVGATIKQANTK